MKTQVVLVTGAGGVGKTTISAALAVRAAESGRKTLVLTVDPARRLADALGVELGREPRPNPSLPGLWGAVLDAEASWAEIARKHTDSATGDRLATSDLFRSVTRHFPASQSYAAAEAMADLVETNRWDVIVVDTPPASGGIEFFTAHRELADFIGGRLIRWITGGRLPGRTEIFNLAGRPALRLLGALLGSDLLERVSEFLFDLRTTYDGVRRRGRQIERHFKTAHTIVVTTADPAPVAEAERFFRALPEVAADPAAVIFNRSLPDGWASAGLPDDPALALNLQRWGSEARRQQTVKAEFARRYSTRIGSLPWHPSGPSDLAALSDLLTDLKGLAVEELLTT